MAITKFLRINAVVVLSATILLLTAAGASARTYECQHPTTTGVEIWQLRHVSVSTACGAAIALYRWATSGHVIVDCVGSNGQTPVLRLRSFHGWRLSLTDQFRMGRGRSSFAVGGTDFPAPCG